MSRAAPDQTARYKERFLGAFAEVGTITTAAQIAGVRRQTVWKWRKDDPAFAAAFLDLEEQLTDKLESTILSKALTDKDVTSLIFLLKARRPGLYNPPRNVNLKGQLNVTFEEALAEAVGDDEGMFGENGADG